MQTRASCASKSTGERKRTSLVATTGKQWRATDIALRGAGQCNQSSRVGPLDPAPIHQRHAIAALAFDIGAADQSRQITITNGILTQQCQARSALLLLRFAQLQ